MTIIKMPNGWVIEPSTRDENVHLTFLIDALKLAYGQAQEVSAVVDDRTTITESNERADCVRGG